MSKYHPYNAGIDWSFWVPVILLGGVVFFWVWLLCMAVSTPDPEPTSRCLDSKYRIFERYDSFSVVEDARCNQVK